MSPARKRHRAADKAKIRKSARKPKSRKAAQNRSKAQSAPGLQRASGPFPIILSSPSGAGKTSIAKALLAARNDLGYSVSCTTRPPRPGEVDGSDYYFLSRPDFIARQGQGAFAESAEVHGNLYGTLKVEIERVMSGGRHVVLDVDVQGAALLRRAFPSVVTIFILPPSGEVLLDRLRRRKTESKDALVRRLESALQELHAVDDYEYVVVNEVLEEAVRRVSAIIDSETVRNRRVQGLREQVAELVQRLETEIETHSS